MDLNALARVLLDKQTYRPSSSRCTTPDGITPFPIRLIHENAPPRRRHSVASITKPQNDDFYRFWDRFLATSPHRTHASALGRRLEQMLKDAGDEENGLHTQESPTASYEQAKKECQAKVQAIIAECTRLNQRYRDRQFEVELAQHDIVLAQPDVSYFKGLLGRYTYCLHFRVYNVKDTTKYLARSMHVSSGNYINTRSVSVDLDLEAGNYNISIKVEPSRAPCRTAESVIESEAPHRKQKLLQVGRNFELAHVKGKLREKEQQVRKEKKDQARREYRERQAELRRRRHEAKTREKRRKGRIAKEKMARERSDLLRQAGFVPAPPPLPPPDDSTAPTVIVPSSFKVVPSGFKVTGCIDIFDNDPNAELDDDDFEWDSDMDGSISSSSSEDEKDYCADDPWNALLVLGLRVYSQSSAVTIKVRDGDETDHDELKSEKADPESQPGGPNTSMNQDITKEPSASNEAIVTPDEDNKSNTVTEIPHEHDNNATVETTSDITIEQKN